MKILVFGHRLEMGGTQFNAIELSTHLRDAFGHEIVYFAVPGAMNGLLEEKGLRFLPAPDGDSLPSTARMRAIDQAIRRERPDLVHIWDWPQYVDAFLSVQYRRVPIAVTCMSMVVTSLLPKLGPTSFGTPDLLDKARSSGFTNVKLIMPPVDTRLNAPESVNGLAFRQRYRVGDGDILLVMVSRLVEWMKAESLRRTIAAIKALGSDRRLRLAIVGGGEAQADLERRAAEVNAELGREAITLTGTLLDPRAAYAAADIVLGMGSSALRGMAFGKPVVIVGERGFSAPFTPKTAEFFYHNGIYGIGDGDPSNHRIVADISEVLDSLQSARELGEFSRQFVLRHYSLDVVGAALNEFLTSAAQNPTRVHHALVDGLRSTAIVLRDRFLPAKLRDQLTKTTRMVRVP